MLSDLTDKWVGFVQATHSQQRQLLRTINDQWTQNNQNASDIERHRGQSETKGYD